MYYVCTHTMYANLRPVPGSPVRVLGSSVPHDSLLHDGSCIFGAPVPFCAVSFPVFIASQMFQGPSLQVGTLGGAR